MILLSSLIKTFGNAMRTRYQERLLPGHEHALQAMEECRTNKSPVMIAACPDCGQREIIPHSCGNRHCPHCQHHEGQEWIERQRAKLLPVDYYLVTFTLPWQLRRLVWQHQRISYDLLLKLGWEVLKTFGLNDSKLKGAIGAHAILHTHSRRLDYHPHAHFVVPAGALDRKHRLWRKKRGKYLFNHEALATVFRAKWLEAMKKAKLKVGAELPKKWVANCKHVGGGDKALVYLGKYLYRGVLQEKAILHCDNGQVTFRYTKNSGEVMTRTMPGEDLLWLLLQHVLPKGFRRVRDYGILHSNSKATIRLLQFLLHVAVRPFTKKSKKPPIKCKVCGQAMAIIAVRLKRPPVPALA